MSVEFHGDGIDNMSIAERMTLCNMGIEFGAKNAVCRPDQKVLDAIKDNAGVIAGSPFGQTKTRYTRLSTTMTSAT